MVQTSETKVLRPNRRGEVPDKVSLRFLLLPFGSSYFRDGIAQIFGASGVILEIHQNLLRTF